MSPLRSGPFWPGDSPANQVCRGPGDGGLDQGRRRQAVGGVRRGLRARDRRAICHGHVRGTGAWGFSWAPEGGLEPRRFTSASGPGLLTHQGVHDFWPHVVHRSWGSPAVPDGGLGSVIGP